MPSPHELLTGAFQAALRAADPLHLLPPYLPSPPAGSTLVVGGGKAAAAMAKAVEMHWPVHAPLSGLVVTRYQHSLPLQRIEVMEASHPLPDDRGTVAATRMLGDIRRLTNDDLLLVLLSGGGSSLLALPDEGLDLQDLRAVTKALLECGAPIQDINTVRKHLSQFSGGRIAALSRAPVVSLIISDVVGDDPAHIASGPCSPDPTTFADAIAILRAYHITPPAVVTSHLQRGLDGLTTDTIKPGNAAFLQTNNHIIGSAHQSLAAAERWLIQQGIHAINLGEIEGESSAVAQSHAALVRQRMNDTARPFALLSGGETTVTLTGAHGRGGRNSEYLLALGMALKDLDSLWALACDTDGLDGSEDNAGAIWCTNTLDIASVGGINPESHLHGHDAYGFFKATGGLVMTGATRTNINDFRLLLVV